MNDPFDSALVFQVARMIFEEGLGATEVSNRLRDDGYAVSREGVYPLIGVALRAGIVELVPPPAPALEEAIRSRFSLKKGRVHVVQTSGPSAGDDVASATARRAAELIKELKRHRECPGIGLGPGAATRDFCRHLARRLSAQPALCPVKLFAITAGCPATRPELSSTAFFNLFPPEASQDRMGLFAPATVEVDRHQQALKQMGARETYDTRHEIDIVVTAMGSFEDPHDLLRQFLPPEDVNPDWLGNVQYRPYSATGPVKEKRGQRAVTLFELDDFTKLASSRDKHVLLMVRSCSATGCKVSKGRACLPLLAQPSLHVWSEVFLDFATARDVVGTWPAG
ncbi:MAG TPA: hypothetical protein VF384_18520 [Planctomycetota bacterium]